MTSSHLAVPSALRQLDEQIGREQHTDALYQALRAVQTSGLPREDIVVHLERFRAANQVTSNSDVVDDNLLLLLDMAKGDAPPYSLLWDAADSARIYLPRAIDEASLAESLFSALSPSDMLPAATVKPSSQLQAQLVEGELSRLRSFEHRPQAATFVRVPRSGFATRPAAVLAPADRMVYEALALRLGRVASSALDERVLWPRSGSPAADEYGRFAASPSNWATDYVVVVDVEGFFESVNHSLLTVFLREYFGGDRPFLLAVEGILGAVMGKSSGLPQGPRASDVFATAFLAPVDAFIAQAGWDFVRYNDDILVGASSILDGRRKLEMIEQALGEIGLRVNSSKATVMQSSTYSANAHGSSKKRLDRFAVALADEVRNHLESSEGDDADEIASMLADLGVADDSLWQLLYHQTMSVDDVVLEVRDLLTPESVELYEKYIEHVSAPLARGLRPEGGTMVEIESDLRESLAVLTGARRVDLIDDVELIQQWFPGLAPFVASYLIECSKVRAERVRTFLTRRAFSGDETDWVSATLCSTLERAPGLVNQDLRRRIRESVLSPGIGAMTKLVMARSLAKKTMLDSATQDKVFSDIPSALGLELLLYIADIGDENGTNELQ